MNEVCCAESAPVLVPAVAVYVAQPQFAQSLLYAVNALYPFGPAEAHLKRIRKAAPHLCQDGAAALEVIVHAGAACHALLAQADAAPSPTTTAAGPTTKLAASVVSFYAPFFAHLARVARQSEADTAAQSLHVVHVPSRAPRRSPELWREWNAVWPLASPRPHPVTPPSAELVAEVTHRMLDVVLPLCLRRPTGQLRMAAAVVDPVTKCVLVTSEGCTTMHETQTAACVPYRSCSSCCVTDAGGVVTEHPVTYVLKQLAALQSPRRVTPAARTVDQTQPYLANDLDLYVSHEPCVMCAMALVHSRIQRVFFCLANPHHGGLGGAFAVHTIPSLNHHYRAYHCVDAAKQLTEALAKAS